MAERQDEKDTTKEGIRASALGRQALQEAGQQTEQAAKEGIQAGAEILREAGRIGSEAVQRDLSEVSQDQQHIVAQAADQGLHLIQEISEAAATYAKTAEATITELQSLTAATRAASASLVDAQRIWADWFSRALQFGTRLPQDILRCRNIQDMASVQSVWIHDSLNGLIEASTEILRTAREAADRSLHPLEEWHERTGRQGWSNGEMGENAQPKSGRQQAGRDGGERGAMAHAEPAHAGDKPARAG